MITWILIGVNALTIVLLYVAGKKVAELHHASGLMGAMLRKSMGDNLTVKELNDKSRKLFESVLDERRRGR